MMGAWSDYAPAHARQRHRRNATRVATRGFRVIGLCLSLAVPASSQETAEEDVCRGAARGQGESFKFSLSSTIIPRCRVEPAVACSSRSVVPELALRASELNSVVLKSHSPRCPAVAPRQRGSASGGPCRGGSARGSTSFLQLEATRLSGTTRARSSWRRPSRARSAAGEDDLAAGQGR